MLRGSMRRLNKILALAGMVGVLLVLANGCAHSERSRRVDQTEERFATNPPTFLAGPASVLLSNLPSFSAQALVETTSPGGQAESISGGLTGDGAPLVFTPRLSGIYFIWDLQQNGGYVLNYPLQGYAPVSSSIRVASVALNTDIIGPM